ncbi:S8 family peptidase [Sorangium sp. So ce426]|uniref:S8 family peptidase n=1 Tax=Sorangium sp. So ce426 TaxID=3133312 RepID=UPI003F5CBAF8
MRTKLSLPFAFTRRAAFMAVALTVAPAHAAAPIHVVEPSDPTASMQWHLDAMRALEGWATVKDLPSTATTLAVIDANIELGSPEMQGRTVTGWDFRFDQPYPTAWILGSSAHGTLVASLAAANTGNNFLGAGVAGPTSAVKVMPLRIVDQSDLCATGLRSDDPTRTQTIATATLRALDYAIDRGAKVINMSLGSLTTPLTAEPFRAVMQKARDRGVLIVTASGNEGIDHDRLASEDLVSIHVYDPADPDAPGSTATTGKDGCLSSVAGSYSKFSGDLTAGERTKWQNGTVEDITVDGKPYKRRYVTAVPRGTRSYPGAFSEAPFNFDNIVVVTGSNQAGGRWKAPCPGTPEEARTRICGGANYGTYADVVAPSEGVIVTAQVIPGTPGTWSSQSGTSLGSPMVAGAAALLRSVRPDLTPQQIKAAMLHGVSDANLRTGNIAPSDVFSVTRMLAAAGIGVADPRPPASSGSIDAPIWNAATRTSTFTDDVTSDPGGSITKRDWTFVDAEGRTTRATSTGASTSQSFPLNGPVTTTLKVTDNAGNTRTLRPVTDSVYGARRDVVKLRLEGAQPYVLDGDLLSGNLAASQVNLQKTVKGTGTMRNLAGQTVTVTVDVKTNLLGGNASGTVEVRDPVRGTLTLTVSSATMTRDTATDAMAVKRTGLTGTFTGLDLSVRDTDD